MKIIEIKKLKSHEKISVKHVEEIVKLIKKAGKFTHPIVVEKSTLVILDGHHRVEAMKRLGYKKIPVQLVDYQKIKVELRHKNLPVSLIRELVLLSGSRGNLLPQKTTKHFFSNTFETFSLSVLK